MGAACAWIIPRSCRASSRYFRFGGIAICCSGSYNAYCEDIKRGAIVPLKIASQRGPHVPTKCEITDGVQSCEHQGTKRHAQLRHQPRSTPLWVGDPDDWALVRHEPRPPLVCPEPGCQVELISYENLKNKYNPRIFKFKSVNRSCGHWPARGGGGPESAQHQWMKLRLRRIAEQLGYTATPEHAPTHADLFVHEVSYCLEVQLKSTQFRQRTATREPRV